jgi:hypothetical protein
VSGTFHDELVSPTAPDLPPRFFDRFVFNAHRADATEPSILFGAGIYPPNDVVDGFVVVVSGTAQRNLRFSTELSSTNGSEVGPFSWQVLEPMKTWHLVLGPNPIGVEFDLVWEARAPAWSGDVTVESGNAATSFDHLFQSGRYHGRLSIDGEESDSEGWYGQRDRSRGVRTLSGGQGLHLWIQAQFPDRSVGFLYVEDRFHDQLLLEGAVMHESGEVDGIVVVKHDLKFDDGLDLAMGRVEVRASSGATYLIDADASAGGGYMAGAGYGGHHGTPMGRDYVAHDVYRLDGSVSPRTLDSALTDRLATFSWEGTSGIGIFEFAHTRSTTYRYRPSLGH